MSPQQIYDSINPDWFVLKPNLWGTEFYSTIIVFNTAGITGCEYTISSPYQTNGLYAGTDAPTTQTDNFLDNLRKQASQRLYDMHCTQITGHKDLEYVFNATE